eukprot:tig00000551_g2039.t1
MQRPSSRGGQMPTGSIPGGGAMARPSSRGGYGGVMGAPLGPSGFIPAQGGMAPGQGGPLRPVTGAMPPGTAMRGGVPGTAQRPGTRGGGGGGIGLNTNVQISERPVTQQGMMGMKGAAAGPGRQVQDKSFFMGELRAKISELKSEIDALTNERDKRQNDTSTMSQLARAYDDAQRKIKTLQAELAVYNLMLDKVRVGAEMDAVRNEYTDVKARNDNEKRRADQIFQERSSKEAHTREIEAQINAVMHQLESRLSELAPGERERYRQLQEQNRQANDAAVRLTADLEDKTREIQRLEEELRADTLRQRAVALEEQKREAEQRLAELQADSANENLPFPEARDRLLNQVRKDNMEIADAERQIRALEKENGQLREQVDAMGADMDETRGEKADKYAELLAKDQEMQAFIERFDENKRATAEAIQKHELMICALLQHISQGLDRQHAMPTAERLKELQEEVEYKRTQLENSQTTAERLKQELQLREMELEKIKTLDQKIGVELESLKGKSQQMREEMGTFSQIEQLKEAHEARKRALVAERQRLGKRKEMLKQQTALLQAKYDTKKMQLSENDVYTQLDSLEQKLRAQEQNNFHLREFIETKERESNYVPLKKECLTMVDELNQLVIKAQTGAKF